MSHLNRDGFNLIERFFLWCAGADKRILMEVAQKDASEIHGRITIGGVIFFTFLTAWASFAWTMATLIETPTSSEITVCVVAGLLVGILKFLWDRRLALAETTRMAWFRIPIAVPLALFSAIPLMIFLLGGYLSDAEDEEYQQQVQAKQESLRDKAKGAIARYHNLQEEVDSLRAREQFYERLRQAEAGGLSMQEAGIPPSELERYGVSAPSGAPGCGVRCQRYQQESIVAGQEHQRKQAALGELRSPQTIRAENQNEIDALEKSSPDIFSRLNLLVRQAKNDPVIGATALILVLIYLTLDLLPALERLLDRSRYHRKLTEKREDEEMKRREASWWAELNRRKRQWIRAFSTNAVLKAAKKEIPKIAESSLSQKISEKAEPSLAELISAVFSGPSSEPTGTDNPTGPNGMASHPEARADLTGATTRNAQAGTPAKASERGPVPPVREDDSDSDSSRREGTVSSTYLSGGNHWESSSTQHGGTQRDSTQHGSTQRDSEEE